jgi:hypothetical protein
VVYHGGPTGIGETPQWEREGTLAGDGLGRVIAGAGDVNGDGFGDVALGAPATSRARIGAVRVFLGGRSGLATGAHREIQGARGGWSFGESLAGAGDGDGDGYADLAVGAPEAGLVGRAPTGTVSVFRGGPDGVVESPQRVIEGGTADRAFGRELGWVRDVDGDGYAELAVGMMGPSSARGGAALSTQVFHGGASGLSATPRRVIPAQAMGDAFPGPLRGPGDVNGDGFADLCVTSAYADGVYRLTRTGVFAGSASGISATPLREIIEGSLSE